MSNTPRKRGFTIVELLIVIVVIAILAAITVVAYQGIQNRTYDTSVQSDLRNIATKMELYKAEQGVYPEAALATLGLAATKSAYELINGIHASHVYNLLYCRNSGATSFALIARAKSGNAFQFANGSVGVYTGPLQSGLTETICQSAGVTVVTTPSPSWTWFYNSTAWQTWVAN